MGWPVCNSTIEHETLHEDPVYNGHTFHSLGLLLSSIFTIIAVVVSFLLIFMHAIHYSRPQEQRHIIRILFMVPIYSAVSLLSYYYYKHSVYFEVMRDCYEAFAIASFFSLMCAYLAPDLHSQKEYFRNITPMNWVWPITWLQRCTGGEHAGPWRVPGSGLTWFNIIWVSIFQYCFIRLAMTIVSVVTQAMGLYCLESLKPEFAHIWVIVIESISVTIAMYCVVQFYMQVHKDILQHKPLLKVLAIKLVIFLSFWQTTILSILTSSGAIKATKRIQTPDIKVGIPSMLLCIEMALFAIFHIWAFDFSPYRIGSKAKVSGYQGGFLGIRALIDSINPWDIVKACARGAKWLFSGRKTRHNDVSYDMSRRQATHPDDPKLDGAAPKPDTDIDPIEEGGFNSRPPTYQSVIPGAPYGSLGGDHIEGETLLANPQMMGMAPVSAPGGPQGPIPGQDPYGLHPEQYPHGPNPEHYQHGLNPEHYQHGLNPEQYPHGANPELYPHGSPPNMVNPVGNGHGNGNDYTVGRPSQIGVAHTTQQPYQPYQAYHPYGPYGQHQETGVVAPSDDSRPSSWALPGRNHEFS
ncbi:hypothetical protein DV738_g3720, partial [Chaetothyriales sp. CBS 135597]